MKIHLNKTGGNVLFGTLLTTGIICAYLGSYLSLVRNENRVTARSQIWNTAIPVAEAGIEEAMTQLQVTYPDIKANNGWNFNGKYLMKKVSLSATEFALVGIFPAEKKGDTPTIVSEGFAQAPTSTNLISRTVRVKTKVNGKFLPGLVVVEKVTMTGTTKVDSFDSSDPTKSANGKYDPTKKGDNGYLATLSGATNLGVVEVWGSIASGPTAGGLLPDVKGKVGDAAWQKTGSGIQEGHYTDDVNMSVEYAVAPFTNALPPLSTSISRKSDLYVMGTPGSTTYTDYAIENLSGDISVEGNTRLLVTKSFNVNSLNIKPGATLELYVAAPTVTLSGNGQLNVQGTAANFKYFGLPANSALGWPGNTTLNAGGNGEFTALIYAPGTDLILHGGGSEVNDFSGAGFLKSILFKGKYGFHYDESAADELAKGYIAITWDEIHLTWKSILEKGSSFTTAQLY